MFLEVLLRPRSLASTEPRNGREEFMTQITRRFEPGSLSRAGSTNHCLASADARILLAPGDILAMDNLGSHKRASSAS